MFFKSTGKIIYDPHRPNLKKKKDWWVTLIVDPEITRYYRWFVMKRYWLKLHMPSWGSHVSIIRGEKPYNEYMHLWKKYHLKEVDFEYSNDIIFRRGFCFVEVKNDFLLNIRKEFKFLTNFGLHLTIGRY